jgi:hypothetical protein
LLDFSFIYALGGVLFDSLKPDAVIAGVRLFVIVATKKYIVWYTIWECFTRGSAFYLMGALIALHVSRF